MTSCEKETFRCNNKCLSNDKKCDYKDDCGDNTDEEGCGKWLGTCGASSYCSGIENCLLSFVIKCRNTTYVNLEPPQKTSQNPVRMIYVGSN